MELQELKKEINRKLNDVNEKIKELKNSSDKEVASNKELQDVLKQLEKIRENILMQYNTINQIKKTNDVKFPELRKNIFNSFESFESAYSKAGSLVRSRKFRNRDRSVDFKNPFGNK